MSIKLTPKPAAPSTAPVLKPHSEILQPFWNTADAFGDVIQPFVGTGREDGDVIQPFAGSGEAFGDVIQPFTGNVMEFWGDAFGDVIQPFAGTGGEDGDVIQPFIGGEPFGDVIQPFDGSAQSLSHIGHYWTNFGIFWRETTPLLADPLAAPTLESKLNEMMSQTELAWGASIGKATGKSFDEAFAAPLFARYGIDPTDGATLQRLTASERAKFVLDWYDTLMGYTGIDRVDHWMPAVRWTPAITQQQGSGADSIIGLIDATASGDPDLADNIAYSGGGSAVVGGHGVGVASLMVAAHDGQGVMGIAPNASVVAFNPYDASNTTSFATVRDGIVALGARGASVINMSLGVPGFTLHPEWKNVFADPQVAAFSDPASAGTKMVFVIAAGNDGSTQLTNITWDLKNAPAMIVVGSVDPSGNISSFSNRPGTACFTNGLLCRDTLMNNFMVAPGELILLPDGDGGFIRRSGTSFAAPLVSGAITLLHDRWPWLANYPKETVDIMLRSARDLGAPGVDPVYGHGMLDVTASQSPLDFNTLRFFEMKGGVKTEMLAAQVRAAGVQTTWEADGVYYHLYEPIGGTFRDFAVPLSSALVGKVGTLTGASEYFQRFVEQRMKDWIKGGSGFTDVAMLSSPDRGGWQAGIASLSPDANLIRQGYSPMAQSWLRLTSPEQRFGFSAGFGQGGMAMNGMNGLGLSSDYGTAGGVNPLLGLASGGPFAAVDATLGAGTTVSFGWTSQHLDHRRRWRSDEERLAFDGVDPFKAKALNVRIAHKAAPGLTVSAAYARVNEANGLLGVQSRYESDLDQGAVSDTITFGASAEIGRHVTLALSATGGRTRSGMVGEQGLATSGDGVLSTAFAAALSKRSIFGEADALRLSVSQPLHVERGSLSYTSVQVIDRETGSLGLAEQTFSLSGRKRPLSGEMLYATPLAAGGELGLFGRAELNSGPQDQDHFVLGGRIGFDF
ncbi:S8 family serine peptidase [Sphingomonas parva]|uniref:S8 family serine peptidase n=1 Tax=Sphingomonas parva TaxID=2555898 RepID=UPI00143142D1|nr:S8 family serine peptidase [Sphingomonas parva]